MDRELEQWLPLGTKLALITKKYFGVLAQYLKELGLDRNYSVLLLLDQENKPVSQQFIADYFLIDKAQMVRIIDYLIKKGMITKEVNASNRREYLVSLTAMAQSTIPAIKKAIKNLEEKAFKGIAQKEKSELLLMLTYLSSNLDAESPFLMSMNLKPSKIKK